MNWDTRRQRPIKDDLREQRQLSLRAGAGFLIIVLLFLGLGARYLWLQVMRHDDFATRSEGNRVRVLPVAPNRGLIYDRRGRLLAANEPAYRLEIVPEQVEDLDVTWAALTRIVALSDEDRERFERVRDRYQPFDRVPVGSALSEDEVARFAVDRHRFEGVDVVPYMARAYPYGDLLTHVLGYVGRLDTADLQRVDPANYRGTSHIGKAGLERQYEDRLHGLSGRERVETNVQGRVLRVLERDDPVPGDDLVLSLDVAVQQAAWDALGDRAGAVVAIDPRDGAVVALVSKPAFDPNAFVHGMPVADYQAILASPRRPLFNRALSGGYEPGSTLKPFIGLAGLELGVINPQRRVFSTGEFYLSEDGRPFRDWKKGGHGWVEIRGALEESVNTFFYQLALDLGIDRIHDYLDQFGFGRPTGVDLPSESSGVLPSTAWKRAQFNESWYPGETVNSGIGQGFNVTTPIQLANALATLANGGRRYVPRLLYAVRPPQGERASRVPAPLAEAVPVNDAGNWSLVQEGLRRVVHGPRGTARAVAPAEGWEMAGKTGTAQVFGLARDQEYVEAEVAEHLRHHALFIAYAPFDAPSLAVAVVVDHGGAGSRAAAPVARAVFDAWLAQEPLGEARLAGGTDP